MTPENQKHALYLLKQLISAQSGGETAVQKLVSKHLQAAGCTVDMLEYEPAMVPLVNEFAAHRTSSTKPRIAVIGTLKGSSELPSITVFAHPDSEPHSDIDRWRHAPFSGKVFDGRVHGWGVADDLAGCAAGLAAMADIASSEVCVGDLVFASTPSKNHARGVSALFHSGHRTDAALYLHPAESGIGMQEIKAVTAGQMEFEVSIKGRPPDTTEPSHTAFSHLGQNPVDKAFLIYRALKALNEARASRVSYPAIEALVGRATNLHVSSIAVTGTTELSRIPESCVVGGATSFPPGERLADVQHEIEHALKQANDADEWLSENPAKIKWISGVTGSEVPEDHPLFIAASQAIERVTGVSPRVNPMHSASDIRNPMIQAGIPCIGLGCLGGNLSQNGATDEWVDEEDFKRMASVVALVIRNWAVA